MNFDLASLAKPLVTAPLSLAFLDLDSDRRWQLGFHDRPEPLTVRQLLSHSAGLPPWRPFTGEPLAAQLRRPVGEDPLLRPAKVGEATYSDLGYRLLGEMLVSELGLPWRTLGAAASGLSPWPWNPAPPAMPPGRDREAWAVATDFGTRSPEPAPVGGATRAQSPELPFPDQAPGLPHDANARAGMIGHAGFASTTPQMAACLRAWAGAGWPCRMAVETARGADGTIWGMGLQRARHGSGRFAELLSRIPSGAGIHVLEETAADAPPPAPILGPMGEPGDWWTHTGYTGGLLCVRPADGTVLALLLHRLGPDGALLGDEAMRARRWQALSRLVDTLAG